MREKNKEKEQEEQKEIEIYDVNINKETNKESFQMSVDTIGKKFGLDENIHASTGKYDNVNYKNNPELEGFRCDLDKMNFKLEVNNENLQNVFNEFARKGISLLRRAHSDFFSIDKNDRASSFKEIHEMYLKPAKAIVEICEKFRVLTYKRQKCFMGFS